MVAGGRDAVVIALLLGFLALVSSTKPRGHVVAHHRTSIHPRGHIHQRHGGGGRGEGSSKDAPTIPGPDETVLHVVGLDPQMKALDDNTQAFMTQWQTACHGPPRKKVRLVVPQGVFPVGPVIFAGPCSSPIIIFQVLGTLKAPTDLSLFDSPEWIHFTGIRGLRLIGPGTLDGQGKTVWRYDGKCEETNAPCAPLAENLKLNNITDGVVRGIHSVDSKGFHMHITASQNIRCLGLRINAPENSPNTDGIHISSSTLVKVANTQIGTGDDCISLGQGVQGVTLVKVVCGPGHGISIGSLGKRENEMDVSNVLVKNSTLTGTTNGLRIKTWPGSQPSKATGIIFQDIIMRNVANPIIIDQLYNCHKDCQKEPSRVNINDVQYNNIKGTSSTPVSVQLVCSTTNPCQNVRFSDVDLKYGAAPTKAECKNVHAAFQASQNPYTC